MEHSGTPLISIIALGFGLSYLFGMVAHKLKLSPIIGYLVAGIILGPQVHFFYNADLHLAHELSEIGVILLMFGVGLHFSLKDLNAVKNVAVPGAIMQTMGTIIFTLILGVLTGFGIFESIIFGVCLSVASTVVLLRSLEQLNLLETPSGKIATGWLIVEDLVTVVILVILPSFSFINSVEGGFSITAFLYDLLITGVKLALFVAVMFYIGRKLIPEAISRSAATGSRELFTLSVLAISLGIAYLAVSVFDISFALGAFFAGMILHESELSHRAAEDTLPLRDAFAVLFFVAVGMLFDYHILVENIWGVLATTFIIIFVKSAIAYFLVRGMKRSHRAALTISVSLAQIGEFSFILAGLAVTYGYLQDWQRDVILAGAIISIVINPFLFRLMEKVLQKLDKKQEKQAKAAKALAAASAQSDRPAKPVLDVAGENNATPVVVATTSSNEQAVVNAVSVVASEVNALSAITETAPVSEVAPQVTSEPVLVSASMAIPADSQVLATSQVVQASQVAETVAPEADSETLEIVQAAALEDSHLVEGDEFAEEHREVEVNKPTKRLDQEDIDEIIESDEKFTNVTTDLEDHYVVVGYGAIGKLITAHLRNHGVEVVVLTCNINELYDLNYDGVPNVFGEFKSLEFYEKCNLECSRGLIFSFDKPYEIGYAIDKIFKRYPEKFADEEFEVCAMATHEDERQFLLNHHVRRVLSVREITAKYLVSHLLNPEFAQSLEGMLFTPSEKVRQVIMKARAEQAVKAGMATRLVFDEMPSEAQAGAADGTTETATHEVEEMTSAIAQGESASSVESNTFAESVNELEQVAQSLAVTQASVVSTDSVSDDGEPENSASVTDQESQLSDASLAQASDEPTSAPKA